MRSTRSCEGVSGSPARGTTASSSPPTHGYDRGQPGRKVHIDRVHWCGDRPVIGSGAVVGRPTEGVQPAPPRPVYDDAVPYWHADLFVQGHRLEVGPLTVALDDSPRPWRVRISQGWSGLRVWVDGRLHL